MSDCLQAIFQVCRDRPQICIGHVPPGHPRHWWSEIMRMKREISLAGSAARDVGIWRLLRSQPITQCVEQLSFSETARSRLVIRSEILRARGEARLRIRIQY